VGLFLFNMEKIRIALQSKGRLNLESVNLLKEAGAPVAESSRKFRSSSATFPLEAIYLRDDDISKAVAMGAADLGIVGLNEVEERGGDVEVLYHLGFGRCRLSLAIPKEQEYTGLQYFNGKIVATSYPKILERFFAKHGVDATIRTIAGSVEVTPSVGISDAIFDIVGSGLTLGENGLKEVEKILDSEALLIANRDLSSWKAKKITLLLSRFEAVRASKGRKYLMFNILTSKVGQVTEITPGMRGPTLFPLSREGWSSIHVVVEEEQLWSKIESLREIGAEGILVLSPEMVIP